MGEEAGQQRGVGTDDVVLPFQATLYKMAQQIIADNASVGNVTYTLPNKHYVPVNLSFMKLENVSPPEKADVFTPIESPRCVGMVEVRSGSANRACLPFFLRSRFLRPCAGS